MAPTEDRRSERPLTNRVTFQLPVLIRTGGVGVLAQLATAARRSNREYNPRLRQPNPPMRRLGTCTSAFLAFFIVLAGSCWFYFSFIGPEAIYNGQRLFRKTQWYGYSQMIPIPNRRFSTAYAYRDKTGAWIREGPYVEYYRNGNFRIASYYLHGHLDGKESVFNEYGIEMFRTY
jgi:hypothetical protein